MKKSICLLLVLLTALPFAGCSDREALESFASFYYMRAEFEHGEEDSIIVSEHRDINGRHSDLNYVLNLYLRGPSDAELASPFPSDIRLISASLEDDTVLVVLSNSLLTLSAVDLTIACTCIAKTCLELTQAEDVTIRTELPPEQNGISITLSADDWIMVDDSASIVQAAEPSAASD